MTLFLKTLILTFSLEGGMIPGHEISLYLFPDCLTKLDIRKSWYTDMQCELDIYKYFYINGGITSFQWGFKNITGGFYPFRLDYQLGVGAKYNSVQIGYAHDCFHPVAPNVGIFPTPKIDSGNDRIFVRVEIKKHLF